MKTADVINRYVIKTLRELAAASLHLTTGRLQRYHATNTGHHRNTAHLIFLETSDNLTVWTETRHGDRLVVDRSTPGQITSRRNTNLSEPVRVQKHPAALHRPEHGFNAFKIINKTDGRVPGHPTSDTKCDGQPQS